LTTWRGKTVTGIYYAESLRKLCAAIKHKRRRKLRQGVLLHHDVAPAHTSAVAMVAIRECGFELLNHPPYSTDLAPSVFQSLKDSPRGLQTFESDKDVIHAIDDWFEQLDEQFFMYDIKALAHHWEKMRYTWRRL